MKSGPISSRTPSKKAAHASNVPGCATFGAQLTRASLSDSQVHTESSDIEPHEAEILSTDLRASCSNRENRGSDEDARLSEVEFNSLDSKWQYCDSEISIRRQQAYDEDNLLPETSQVPRHAVDVNHEFRAL